MDILDAVLQSEKSQAVLLIDSKEITYAQLAELTAEFAASHFTHRGLIAIECANELTPVIAYLSAVRYRMPCMLLAPGSISKSRIVDSYSPSLLVQKVDDDWQINATGMSVECHDDLAVLLSTSGSTGSAKFVRLSRENIISNAKSIAEYLKLDGNDRGITSLPFHYSYGLSVINSHLVAGASIVISNASVKDEVFWQNIDDLRVTNFAGVPYTFEILEKIDFLPKKSHNLRFVTQAGGRLSPEKVKKFHTIFSENDIKFYVMYGQTEATARIAYVPPEELAGNEGCIGIAVPNGKLRLLDDEGREISAYEQPGELSYTGPNVMMGYAESGQDLIKGDEVSTLRTGDLAAKKSNGLYYIVGRIKRFIKIYGVRTNLDEIELRLNEMGERAICTGTDGQLVVAVLKNQKEVRRKISEFLDIPPSSVTVLEYEELPLLPSGKFDYQKIIADSNVKGKARKNNFRDELANILQIDRVEDGDSFISLGGDSLSYVEATVTLEEHLGFLPDKWQNLTMRELEELSFSKSTSHWLKPFEISIFLRAFSIFTIVSGHFKFFSLPGGAALLFVVAGFNFSRFQLPAIIHKDSALPVFSLLWRIFLPTVFVLGFFSVLSGRLDLPALFLVSNYWPPDAFGGRSFWFIEVLIQVYVIIFLIFSLSIVRKSAGKYQFYFIFVMVLVSYGVASLIEMAWNTEYLYHRVPHIMLGVFSLGALIGVAELRKEKLVTTMLAIILLHQSLFDGRFERSDYMFIGAMLLLWVPFIKLPWSLSTVFSLVASASMYTYLSHFKAKQVLHLLLGDIDSAVAVVFALVVGIVFWWVWERGVRFAQQFHLTVVKPRLKSAT